MKPKSLFKCKAKNYHCTVAIIFSHIKQVSCIICTIVCICATYVLLCNDKCFLSYAGFYCNAVYCDNRSSKRMPVYYLKFIMKYYDTFLLNTYNILNVYAT